MARERKPGQPTVICRGCLDDASLHLMDNFAPDHGLARSTGGSDRRK